MSKGGARATKCHRKLSVESRERDRERERERERENLFAKIINNNIITQREVQWQVARGSINSISAGHLCRQLILSTMAWKASNG